MKSYNTKTPRTALGLVAATMSALTFGLLVAAPMQAQTTAPVLLAQASSTAPTPTEVAIYPARIEVVATRTAALSAPPAWTIAPKAKTQG